MLSAAAGAGPVAVLADSETSVPGVADEHEFLFDDQASEETIHRENLPESEETDDLFTGLSSEDLSAEIEDPASDQDVEKSSLVETESTELKPESRFAPVAPDPGNAKTSKGSEPEFWFAGKPDITAVFANQSAVEIPAFSDDFFFDNGISESLITLLHGPQGPPLTGSTSTDFAIEAAQGGITSQPAYPELPGLQLTQHELSTPPEDQVFLLDFDGVESFTYEGPVTVEGLTIPAFHIPTQWGLDRDEAIERITERVESIFSDTGFSFTTDADSVPRSTTSTLFIGGGDDAFSEYGSFYGLAEGVDVGNQDPTDRALVFSDSILEASGSLNSYLEKVAGTVAREVGRLIGYENTASPPEGAGLLFEVAESNDFSNTLILDDTRDILADGLEFLRGFFEDFENDTLFGENLEALGASAVDFDAESQLGARIADLDFFSLRWLFSRIEEELTQTLFPTGGQFPSANDVINRLKGISQIDADSIVGGGDSSNNELVFKFTVDWQKIFSEFTTNLGSIANDSGIFAAEEIALEATGGLTFDFEFGVRSTTAISDEERFFIRLDNIDAGIEGSTSELARMLHEQKVAKETEEERRRRGDRKKILGEHSDDCLNEATVPPTPAPFLSSGRAGMAGWLTRAMLCGS